MPEKRQTKLFTSSIQSALDLLANSLTDKDGNKPRVNVVAGQEHMRQMAQQEGGDIKTPYIAALVENVQLNREEYQQKILNQQGIVGGYVSEDADRLYRWHPKPLLTSVGILYIAKDYEQILDFCEKWFQFKSKIHFSLDAQDGTQFHIKVSLNDEIQVPEVQFQEVGPFYTLETQLTLHNYTTTVAIEPVIQQTNVTTSAVVETTNTNINIDNNVTSTFSVSNVENADE